MEEQRELHSQPVFYSAGGNKHVLKDLHELAMLNSIMLIQSTNVSVLTALVSEDQDVIEVEQMLQAMEGSRRHFHTT